MYVCVPLQYFGVSSKKRCLVRTVRSNVETCNYVVVRKLLVLEMTKRYSE